MNSQTHPYVFRTLMIVLSVAAVLLVICSVTGWPTILFGRTGALTTSSLQAQLTQAGYEKIYEEQYFSGNAGRMVTNQHWQRGSAPEGVILSNDTPAGADTFVINAITYTGADGDGGLTCQPKDNKGRDTPLSVLVIHSNELRHGIHDGTLHPNGNPGGFPYNDGLVGCMR